MSGANDVPEPLGFDERYVAARHVLLDALTALGTRENANNRRDKRNRVKQ